MQIAKHILSITLVFTILVSGLPSFIPEDVNRDSRVDLKDAVLHVQDFAQTADNPEAFTANFENAVSALQALAGLKTVIKPANNAKSTTASPSLDLPYLISSFDFLFAQAVCSKPAGQFFYYQSISVSPDSPPPQDISVC